MCAERDGMRIGRVKGHARLYVYTHARSHTIQKTYALNA